MKIRFNQHRKNLKRGDIAIVDHDGDGPTCEHCGNMPPFSALLFDGGTWWCINGCVDAINEEVSEESMEKIDEECLRLEKAYIQKRYKELFPRNKYGQTR